MPAVLYIVGADRSITSQQPDLSNKAVVSVAIPNGLPVGFVTIQLSSLVGSLQNTNQDVSAVVIEVTIG